MGNEIIDAHIHFGAPEDEKSGCYWSPQFASGIAYFAMLLLTKSLFKKVDIHRVKKHLLGVINGTKYVDKSVILALDEVYDEEGVVQKEKTHLHVPNRYVARLAAENERVLFGASIHPYRPDWRDELAFCLENGAVLCKWIPSSQLIDPGHSLCQEFYEKLAVHNLPLLYHAGPEYAIPTSNHDFDEFNNPRHLRMILDNGVTVIIAHCAMPFLGDLDTEYQDDFKEFLKLFEEADRKNWKLYADLSAICSPVRNKYVQIIKERLDEITPQRLIFASDYPIPLSELCYQKSANFFAWLWYIFKVIRTQNYLDKNYLLIKGMDFGDEIFTNASELFGKIVYCLWMIIYCLIAKRG